MCINLFIYVFIILGPPVMLSGSNAGHIAVWNLEERKLSSQIRAAHTQGVQGTVSLSIYLSQGGAHPGGSRYSFVVYSIYRGLEMNKDNFVVPYKCISCLPPSLFSLSASSLEKLLRRSLNKLEYHGGI